MARTITSKTLTIANGQTDSDVWVLPKHGYTIVDVTVFTPAALTGTATLYAGVDEDDDTIAEMAPVYISGANVTLPAAKCIPVPVGGVRTLAVASGSAEGAARTFKLVLQLEL